MLNVRRLVVALVSASALVTLAACSTAPAAEVGSNEAAFATCTDPTPHSRPVTLDVDALAKLRCGHVMGSQLLELEWAGDFYWTPVSVSSDPTECLALRDEVRAFAEAQDGLSGVLA